MRFIIMHKTNAHWEAGAIPSRELIARVGNAPRRRWPARTCSAAAKVCAPARGCAAEAVGRQADGRQRPLRRRQRAVRRIQHRARRGRIEQAIDWASRLAEVHGRHRDRHPAGHRALGHRHGAEAGRPHDAALHGAAEGRPPRRRPTRRRPAQRAALSRLVEETTRTRRAPRHRDACARARGGGATRIPATASA